MKKKKIVDNVQMQCMWSKVTMLPGNNNIVKELSNNKHVFLYPFVLATTRLHSFKVNQMKSQTKTTSPNFRFVMMITHFFSFKFLGSTSNWTPAWLRHFISKFSLLFFLGARTICLWNEQNWIFSAVFWFHIRLNYVMNKKNYNIACRLAVVALDRKESKLIKAHIYHILKVSLCYVGARQYSIPFEILLHNHKTFLDAIFDFSCTTVLMKFLWTNLIHKLQTFDAWKVD